MPATSALLVIDVQQGLCQGEYAAHDVPGLIQRINTLSEKARAAGAPVVFIQHEAASGPLQHDSPGWALADGLTLAEGDLRVRKTTPDSFMHTGLEAHLHQRGIARVVICGLQTEFCVDTTTRRAMALGFPVTLVADGHSTMDSAELSAPQIIAHHNRLLPQISSFGPRTHCVRAEEVRFD
ncbi:cysteine hydrolase family protein [Ideonella sp.]|jgi:nicotinamidase-related amidase|uniref:cysteine hydrolase family protein n=1 Tax=Ideonella sp. TaxID=1929293 RepID=UPI0037BFF4E7